METFVKVNDFKVPCFIMCGFFIVVIIVTYFYLDVEIINSTNASKGKREFSWLLNPAPLSFFFSQFIMGTLIGSLDTFFFVFAEEDLKSSVTFLGYVDAASTISCMIIMFFTRRITDRLGFINTYCIGMTMFSFKLVAYSLTYSSPAYPLIAINLLDVGGPPGLTYVTTISYTAVIAPQSLIATAVSIGSVLCWIVGMSHGAFLSGFLVNNFGIRVMFRILGSAGVLFFLLYLVLYHTIIKNYEIDQNQKNSDPIPNKSSPSAPK